MAKKKRPLARRPRPEQRAAAPKKNTDELDATNPQDIPQVEVQQAGPDDSELDEGPTSADEVIVPEQSAASTDHPMGAVLDTDDSESQEGQDEADADTDIASGSNSDSDSDSDSEPSVDDGDADLDSSDFDGYDSLGADEYTGPTLVGDGPSLNEAEVEDVEQYLKGLVEAIIFSSDKPQSAKEVARAARLDRGRVQELIDSLVEESKDRGVRLVAVADGYAFRTNPAYSSYVREFLAQRPVRLSRAQLETLAIMAYRQPLTRPEVDDIRGVDSGAVIKVLLERDLIRVLGKKDEPGRPMIYGTTTQFLELFSLSSLRDLPTLREFTELSDDSRAKFELEVGEPAPEGRIDPSSFDPALSDEVSAGLNDSDDATEEVTAPLSELSDETAEAE